MTLMAVPVSLQLYQSIEAYLTIAPLPWPWPAV